MFLFCDEDAGRPIVALKDSVTSAVFITSVSEVLNHQISRGLGFIVLHLGAAGKIQHLGLFQVSFTSWKKKSCLEGKR